MSSQFHVQHDDLLNHCDERQDSFKVEKSSGFYSYILKQVKHNSIEKIFRGEVGHTFTISSEDFPPDTNVEADLELTTPPTEGAEDDPSYQEDP